MKKFLKNSLCFVAIGALCFSQTGCFGYYMGVMDPAGFRFEGELQLYGAPYVPEKSLVFPRENVRIDTCGVVADVYLDGEFKGKTPNSLQVKKYLDQTITIKADGYETVEFVPERISAISNGELAWRCHAVVWQEMGWNSICLFLGVFTLSPFLPMDSSIAQTKAAASFVKTSYSIQLIKKVED